MVRHIRKRWLRLVIAGCVFAAVIVIFLGAGGAANARAGLLGALPAVVALFAITATLSLALTASAVFGLREKTLDQIRRTRELAWRFSDEFSSSTDPSVRALLDRHVAPLLRLNLRGYLEPDSYKDWSEGIKSSVDKLQDTPQRDIIVHRHLLPLEEELNLLSILFIRRVIVPLHLAILTETFCFIVLAVLAILVGAIMPRGAYFDVVVGGGAAAVCVYAVLLLLVVSSFLRQEASEESLDEAD